METRTVSLLKNSNIKDKLEMKLKGQDKHKVEIREIIYYKNGSEVDYIEGNIDVDTKMVVNVERVKNSFSRLREFKRRFDDYKDPRIIVSNGGMLFACNGQNYQIENIEKLV